MKKQELLSLFENAIRCQTLIDGARTHVPQSQASEQIHYAHSLTHEIVNTIRKELNK